MLLISTGIFDDKLHPQMLLVGTIVNAALRGESLDPINCFNSATFCVPIPSQDLDLHKHNVNVFFFFSTIAKHGITITNT
jgi:hypothetical protein